MELSQNSMKSVLLKEQQQIKQYIQRKGGTFIETGTGVHYFIYQKSDSNKQPKSGDEVEIKYLLTLLNGDTVVNKLSNSDKIKVEFDEKESGLHETIKLLSVGDKAFIIIPSHRAHGLTGNDVNIPPLSTLVYQIEIVKIL